MLLKLFPGARLVVHWNHVHCAELVGLLYHWHNSSFVLSGMHVVLHRSNLLHIGCPWSLLEKWTTFNFLRIHHDYCSPMHLILEGDTKPSCDVVHCQLPFIILLYNIFTGLGSLYSIGIILWHNNAMYIFDPLSLAFFIVFLQIVYFFH